MLILSQRHLGTCSLNMSGTTTVDGRTVPVSVAHLGRRTRWRNLDSQRIKRQRVLADLINEYERAA